MRRSIFSACVSAGLIVGLAGCTTPISPKTYDCSARVSVPEVGDRMVIASKDGQDVAVRLNGVTADCHNKKGMTVFNIGAGLKLSRDLQQRSDAQHVDVPFIAALLDGDDNIVGHNSFGYSMAFGSNIDVLYPLNRFKLRVPEGGRVVLSLITERIETQ